ncbi:MAG TPA: PilZ domain-containing protein [Terriglobales bacterium]|nr:PilZ domain-containing protein [Terriglobales bacterium]
MTGTAFPCSRHAVRGQTLKESKRQSQRGTERHSVTIPVQVTIFEGKRYVDFRGEASDFSASGLCLVLTRQLEKDTALSVKFHLPYNSQVMDMRGIVRRRSGFHHGIEFISVTAYQQELLKRTSKILDLLR